MISVLLKTGMLLVDCDLVSIFSRQCLALFAYFRQRENVTETFATREDDRRAGSVLFVHLLEESWARKYKLVFYSTQKLNIFASGKNSIKEQGHTETATLINNSNTSM